MKTSTVNMITRTLKSVGKTLDVLEDRHAALSDIAYGYRDLGASHKAQAKRAFVELKKMERACDELEAEMDKLFLIVPEDQREEEMLRY